MGKPNKRVVQQRDGGDWEVRKPGASRASAVTQTQADGIGRARVAIADGSARARLQAFVRATQQPSPTAAG